MLGHQGDAVILLAVPCKSLAGLCVARGPLNPARPALPSNTKGPALFVGVMGPSTISCSAVGVCALKDEPDRSPSSYMRSFCQHVVLEVSSCQKTDNS